MKESQRSWTNGYYHDNKGKILGGVLLYNDRYKATLGNMFIGFYITEETAQSAIEEAYLDSLKEPPTNPIERSIKSEYTGARYARSN